MNCDIAKRENALLSSAPTFTAYVKGGIAIGYADPFSSIPDSAKFKFKNIRFQATYSRKLNVFEIRFFHPMGEEKSK